MGKIYYASINPRIVGVAIFNIDSVKMIGQKDTT